MFLYLHPPIRKNGIESAQGIIVKADKYFPNNSAFVFGSKPYFSWRYPNIRGEIEPTIVWKKRNIATVIPLIEGSTTV